MTDRPKPEDTIALLDATLEATRDAILVVSLDRRILRYNRHYLEMFGFTAEELASGGYNFIVDRITAGLKDAPAALDASQKIWADPTIPRLDVYRFKDGRVIERFVAPLMIGERLAGRTASFRDISAAVRIADALAQHQTFLEQAQEVAHIGSWVAELDGSDRLGWSAESHRIFGVPLGEFAGSSEAFLAFVHADDRAAVRAASEAAAAGGPPYDIEHRLVRPDGTVRWVHQKASILRDAQGRALRMVGTVQDLTERRLLEDQLRQSQKMEAIGRLAGGIAHDLNNALTAIAGYAELALGEVASDHAARADVEEIRRAAERAGSVTRQLLAFSRKQLLEPRVFDLNETIAAISRLLSRLLGADVEVQTQLPAAAAGARDPDSRAGGDQPRAQRARRDARRRQARDRHRAGDGERGGARKHPPMPAGSTSVLRVSDSGHGMTHERRLGSSSRSSRPGTSAKAPASGCRCVRHAEAIGGFIFVDSEIDRGTTFTLYFRPAAEPERAALGASSARGNERHGHETLMIVEDEPSVRSLVASALRHDGYRLLIASSAEEALTQAGAHDGPIDLLLTDAMMPGKSGVELAGLLTAQRPGLPVIVMSGYTEDTLDVPGLKEPIALLQKPFSPRELRRRIREVLDR